MNSQTKRVKSVIKYSSLKKIKEYTSQVYLTEEEYEVLMEHVVKGIPMSDVANDLNISIRTAGYRLKSALIKLSAVI